MLKNKISLLSHIKSSSYIRSRLHNYGYLIEYKDGYFNIFDIKNFNFNIRIKSDISSDKDIKKICNLDMKEEETSSLEFLLSSIEEILISIKSDISERIN